MLANHVGSFGGCRRSFSFLCFWGSVETIDRWAWMA